MLLRPPVVACALLCAALPGAACLVDNPNFDSGGASSSAGASEGDLSAAADASTSTGSGASSSGSDASDETTGALSDGATGQGTTADPSTTAATTTSPDATTTEDSTSDASTTEDPEPSKMRLQRYDEAKCTIPLWCVKNMNPYQPVPARIFSQECFTGLTPPFKITRLGYWVAQTHFDPFEPSIALRSYNGAPSTDAIQWQALAPGDVTPGYHNIDLDWTISASSFCIGLTGGANQSSLGIATDAVAPPADQSFYRSDGPYCYSNGDFWDIADLNPTNTGRWCIDVDIEQL